MVDVWLLFSVIISLLTLVFFLSPKSPKPNHNLPPSPSFSLPVIGHLHFLAYPPCRPLFRLSQSLGPIFSLRFGSRLVVVISSTSLAEDCSTKNDVVLADRPPFLFSEQVIYNSSNLATTSYGTNWMFLRRVFSAQIFSPARLNSFTHIRTHAVACLVRNVSRHNKVVVLRPLVKEMMFQIMTRILLGEKGEVGVLMKATEDLSYLIEKIDPVEFAPMLRLFDFGRYNRKLKRSRIALDGLLQKILDERRQISNKGGEGFVIDNLLQLQQSEPHLYDDVMIKGFALLMLSGTTASVVTIEWAMSLLLNHPTIMSKAKNEIDTQVGQDRAVNHSDLPSLPYLHNIISETLRLYPSTPLLVPRHASQDCTIGGYSIPSETLVLVNSWAIHRDPSLWDEPLRFRPERFEGINYKVHQYMPIGLGRRTCPGYGFAKPVVALALASLIQCFEWERCSVEEMDMTEGGGLHLVKAKPFEAVCRARPILSIAYA